MQRLNNKSMAMLFVVVIVALPRPCGADEPKSAKAIAALVSKLDSPKFRQRQAAWRQLREIGKPAFPQLMKAAEHGTPEASRRALAILKPVLAEDLDQEFRRLARAPENNIDLEHGMWLIARINNPLCRKSKIDQRLDALAAKVKKAFGNRDPVKADPQFAVNTLVRVLFSEVGFRGNTENYRHPDNSSIETVLSTRKGLPILLSHVVVSVAQRLDLPVVGVGVPSRYMAKYDGDDAPVGFPRRDVFMDPFGGRVIQEADIFYVVGRFDPDVYLVPSPKLMTLARMLNNLASHHYAVGNAKQGELTTKYYALLSEQLPKPEGSNPFR